MAHRFMSPIVMYQIKKSKEEALKQNRIAQLAAEGLDEDEIAERMARGDMGGGEAVAGGRPNALATLIAQGARVTATSNSGNQDAIQRIERRRMQRTVDVYLTKSLEVQVRAAS